MDPRNGHVETIGALGARKSEIVAILRSLDKQFEAVVTIDEKRRIKNEWRSIYRILEAVNLKIREYDEQRALDMYLKAYSPTHSLTMKLNFPQTFEALQTSRKDLWAFLMSLYPEFEVASTMMEKSALISDMKTGMLMLGSVMYEIKEYDGTTIAADWYRNAAARDQQESNIPMATMNLEEWPAVAAPAHFSAPAPLTNGHLSATSSNVKSKPKSSVDTIVQMDLITIPTCTSDSDSDAATTSHNIGINGVRASFSAPAPLLNDHLSTSSSDVEPESEASADTRVSSDLNTLPPPANDTATTSHNTGMNGAVGVGIEPEPERSLDTSVSLDLITLPPPAGDIATTSHNTGMNGAMAVGIDRVVDSLPPSAGATATTSHNTGMNRALGVRIDRMLGSLARLADVVRNA